MGFPLILPDRVISIPVFEFRLTIVPPSNKSKTKLQKAIVQNEYDRVEKKILEKELDVLRGVNSLLAEVVKRLKHKLAASMGESPPQTKVKTDSVGNLEKLQATLDGLEPKLEALNLKVRGQQPK